MTHVLAQAGGQTTQWIQVAVWVLLLSLSFLGWLFRMISQKRAESKVMLDRKRREEEMLRTGRMEDGTPIASASSAPAPTSADEAKRRLQELAQRRRAELQQAAQRAQRPQAAGPVAAGPAAGPGQSRPGLSPAEEARRRTAQQQKAARARAEQIRREREQSAQSAAQRTRREQEIAERQQRERAKRETAEREAAQREQARVEAAGVNVDAALVTPAPRGGAAQAVPGRAGGPRAAVRIGGKPTIDDIRRAFVMSEVLAPPISERGPGEDDAAFGAPTVPVRRAG